MAKERRIRLSRGAGGPSPLLRRLTGQARVSQAGLDWSRATVGLSTKLDTGSTTSLSTAPDSIILHSIAFDCTALDSIALDSTSLDSIARYSYRSRGTLDSTQLPRQDPDCSGRPGPLGSVQHKVEE